MREIKFRAWNKLENKMEYFDLEDIDYRCRPEYYELMQFIGLLDKNGKEIYEGDIVKIPNGDICEIIYKMSNDSSGFIAKPKQSLYQINFYAYFTGEVIGDIYSNPELMKEV
jgi:uncharacterized phage protein (TIGR01671 family)